MEFYLVSEDRFGFRGIHPLIADLVRAIPKLIDSRNLSEAAENRLFPPPGDEDEVGDLCDDWSAFVQPGLLEHFSGARDRVASDLRGMREADDGSGMEFEIPVKHIDEWLNVLNQVRLALVATVGLDGAELESVDPPDLLSERGVALFQVNLFGFMQQCLIDQID